MKTIYFAGGCFWGVQKFFDQFRGVVRTECGYANGETEKTDYGSVDDTGHAETVRVDYDEDIISLEDLLGYYFEMVDPTAVNRQGPDIGTQYRTGIFYTDDGQRPAVEAALKRCEEKIGQRPAVIAEPLRNYCTAEEGHQKYLDRFPGGYCHLPPYMFRIQENKDRKEKSDS